MILNHSEIKAQVARGRIKIEPFAASLIRRASYTLRLDNRWMRWKRLKHPIDLWSKDAARSHIKSLNKGQSIIVSQGDFVLASTKERIQLPDDILALICPLSHIARFGLSATSDSLLISPGYGARSPKPLTLELTSLNPSPLKLHSGLPICHLIFIRVNKLAKTFKKKHLYEECDAPCPPLLYEDMFETIFKIEHKQTQSEIGA
jgi:dCTP deaminase